MASGKIRRQHVTSGLSHLDELLGSLYIGDNVIWYDQAGSLANIFCLSFLKSCQDLKKPVIYVSFDRSPRTLMERLGPMAENPRLTILDCFTWGKGAGSDVFLSFYYDTRTEWPCRIVRVDEPKQVNQVIETLYGIHSGLEGDVRFIFESLTGMQELWGGEDNVLNFYSHSCPRLYELNTVAYWIIEKDAHTPRLRAQINQIAQVVIDLSIKRGTTFLAVLKAEGRTLDNLHKPYTYWSEGLEVKFEEEKRASGRIDIGRRLKEARTKRGISQTELAKGVGVTPSTISQIESNLIYPSLPALFKMAEVLAVDAGSFFQERPDAARRFVFSSAEGTEVRLPRLPEDTILARSLAPVDLEAKAEPYLIEIAPKKTLTSHFFVHKGEELGYLLSGRLQVTVEKTVYKMQAGDMIYLTSHIPDRWKNPGPALARLLWLKLK
jgi:transcriptional regulator with XRE-family HTH domain